MHTMSDKWNLDDIYTGFDSPEFLADFEGLKDRIEEMNGLSAKLTDFAQAVELILMYEDYCITADRLGSYIGYVASTNTEDEDASKYEYLLETRTAEGRPTEVRLSAFLAKHEKDIEELAKAHGLEDYIFKMRVMIEEHAHLMSEEEETLATQLAATGSSAWALLHEELTANLVCKYKDPIKDKIRKINITDCRNLAYNPNAKVRKAAYKAELSAYRKIAESCAAALNGIKGEVNLTCRKRHFAGPLEQTLFESGLTQKTLDAMFAAIDENIEYFRDYLKAKARYLNSESLKGLPFYDLYAPVGNSAKKDFTYEDAKKFVLENFAKFSPAMAQVAQQAFDEQWIDVYPREGKVDGAYCGRIYAVNQFRILLNFGGNLSDAITLAHELGHGYHNMQLMNERYLNTDEPMPLAETASTFCEIVVTNAALETLEGQEKLQLLENSLQEATGTIIDIYSRFLFEKEVFDTRLDHPLTVKELKKLMKKSQRATYGDGLHPDYLHPYMWLIKPHYYDADESYYNFPYAFGLLLANGLYKIYTDDPGSFEAKYNNFLRATGKMYVKDCCALLGIDVEDISFWRAALDVIKKNIEEFKQAVPAAL
ncbi:MAG: M3 family oligoendopeptidase [Defluviitaleaceae bacterium]|nr:M3 family oligoendopeptidase [Defluviitaleaceae bacterium]